MALVLKLRSWTELQAVPLHCNMCPIVIHNAILLCLSRCVAAVYRAVVGWGWGGGVKGVYGGSCF